MPTKYHERGSFILRRRFRGLGAIRRSSGTSDLRTFRALDRMLLSLYDTGRWDILRSLIERRLHPLDVFSHFRQSALDALPTADILPHLASRWASWLADAETSPSNRRARAQAWTRLRDYVPEHGNLSCLPSALAKLRADSLDVPRSFNLTRAASLAFARDLLGKQHQLWKQVANIGSLKVQQRVEPRPFRAADLRLWIIGLPAKPRRALWTMAVTGAGPKEYCNDGIEVLADRVRIHGQKRHGRDRFVPLLPDVVPAEYSYSRLRKVAKPLLGARSLYDLRRTYANLLVEALVPANRRALYLGHGVRNETARYERPELTAWLESDAAALSTVLGLKPAQQAQG